MLSGHDIIALSCEWDIPPLSKHHVMSRLATANRVLWVVAALDRAPSVNRRNIARAFRWSGRVLKPPRRVLGDLWVFTPPQVPRLPCALDGLRGSVLVASIKRASRRLGFRRPILWTFLPQHPGVIGRLGEKLSIYHVTDDFPALSNDRTLSTLEGRVVRSVDLVISSARTLHETRGVIAKRAVYVTHGADVSRFAAAERGVEPASLSGRPRPIIGFHGEIGKWIDLCLVEHCARARPRWTFLLVGPNHVGAHAVFSLSNVVATGRVEYGDLPSIAAHYDAAIVPMIVDRITASVHPLKLKEYFALGVPVVSTALPEVARYGELVRVAADAESFLSALDESVAEKDPKMRERRKAAAERETWEAKIEELSTAVEALLAERGA